MKNSPGISKILNLAANYVELGISVTLFGAIGLLMVRLIGELGAGWFQGADLDFTQFMSKAFALVIGVEFTRMLCRHTPDTILEVLMFTIARQLIVSHASILDTLIGILAIGILFVTRRFVIIGAERSERASFRAFWSRHLPHRLASTPAQAALDAPREAPPSQSVG